MLSGVWRGIYIQQRYSNGEMDLTMQFGDSKVQVYKSGSLYFTANVISLGSDIMIFHIKSGAGAGHSLSAQYQLAINGMGMYYQMTMAFGILDGPFPADFNTAMYTTGMKEAVLTKCIEEPCVFSKV